ncbi:MAG: N-acetylmuramoyl-L-alanine amidase [Gammaproteobacteria bacterium]|nr:N-acetylmuramoyl-L-alanine amidase [Gammaproteobacteria bacterium]
MNKLFTPILLLLPFCFGTVCLADSSEECLVAIDIGHSPGDAGATGARGVEEYYYNKNIAMLLEQRLNASDLSELSINPFIITKKHSEMSLFSRASLANIKGADLLVSIHHDSVQPQYLKTWQYNGEEQLYSDDFSGFSVFFSGRSLMAEASRAFAGTLADELQAEKLSPSLHHAEPIPGENRPLIDAGKGIYQYDGLFLLKRAKMPAVLLECGLIVNREEERLLSAPVRQTLLVSAISRAITNYCRKHTSSSSE